MFRLFIDPGWLLYAYAVDGLIAAPGWALLPELYTPDGLNVFLAVGFFLCHTLGGY